MTVVALIAPPIGVLLGVALGALVEPWKLRFLAGARRRQLREERCAEVVHYARDLADGLREVVAVFEMKQLLNTPLPAPDRGRQAMDEARKAAIALRSATALVELSGPDQLAIAARAVRDAVGAVMLDPRGDKEAFEQRVGVLEGQLDAFVAEARKHVS